MAEMAGKMCANLRPGGQRRAPATARHPLLRRMRLLEPRGATQMVESPPPPRRARRQVGGLRRSPARRPGAGSRRS